MHRDKTDIFWQEMQYNTKFYFLEPQGTIYSQQYTKYQKIPNHLEIKN